MMRWKYFFAVFFLFSLFLLCMSMCPVLDAGGEIACMVRSACPGPGEEAIISAFEAVSDQSWW